MALVTKFERTTKERPSIHRAVNCEYTIFTGSDGKRYLQLDTFGSQTRQIVGKVSQSIQIDSVTAAELKRIIELELL
jgi:hypothetical protein